jgi:hypothetical protein
VTLPWIDRPGDDLRFSTAKGRVEPLEEGAGARFDAPAKRYLGVDTSPMSQSGDVRVTRVVDADGFGTHPVDEV